MKRTYKNVYGDGTIEYVEYEIAEYDPTEEEATDEEIVEALEGIA